ncbi:MAG: hypothetical protein R3E13_08700 [Alphaproteobacteria bacterium]
MALTATEKLRVQKFNHGRDPQTASAMEKIFELTKPGCDEHAYELFEAAHTNKPVSPGAIARYAPLGIVNSNGSISKSLREAIKEAVAKYMLKMRTSVELVLKPDIRSMDYE